MKAILIAILAALSIVLVGVSVYQKLNQPEIMPIGFSQQQKIFSCEGKTDCVLAYTGTSACAPCDSADVSIQCVSPAEAERLHQERIKKYGSVFCEMCQTPLQEFTCFCQNSSCAKVVVNQPVATISDEIAEWKTHINQEYGFEVKYPNSWYAETNTPKYVGFVPLELKKAVDDGDGDGYGYEVTIYVPSGFEKENFGFCNNIEDCIRPKPAADGIFYGCPNKKVASQKDIVIAGKNAVEVFYGCNYSNKVDEAYLIGPYVFLQNGSDILVIQGSYTRLVVEKDPNREQIFENQKANFDQMISTFKFIK